MNESRKALATLGLVLMGIGFLLFMAPFCSGAMFFSKVGQGLSGHGPDPNAMGDSMGGVFSAFGLAPIGFLLIVAGQICRSLGMRGAAGSGLNPDPDQYAEDLKPWAEAEGKLLDDKLSQVSALKNLPNHPEQATQEVVKVRCPNCKTLNDEDAKYCDNCGQPF